MLMSIVGCRPFDFKDDDGRDVRGVSVYFTAPDSSSASLRGEIAGKFSVMAGSPLYNRLISLDYENAAPINCNAVYDMRPGAEKAKLVDLEF